MSENVELPPLLDEVDNVDNVDNGDDVDAITSQTEEMCLDGFGILDMPVEIFIKICNYIRVEDMCSLEEVCAQFADIIAEHNLWRRWMRRKMRGAKCPLFEDQIDVDWRKEALDTDTISHRWREGNLVCIEPFTSQCAVIDAMLFKNDGTICITGSRDRSLAMWNVKEIVEMNMKMANAEETYIKCYDSKPTMLGEAHGGWIWDITSPSDRSNHIYTSSWDHTVKLWDLSSDIVPVQTFKCLRTALCVTCLDENVSVVGLFTPDIAVLDRRASDSPVKQFRIHKRSVLCICKAAGGAGTVVYTTSEDGTVGVFDMTNETLVRKIPLYGQDDAINANVYGLKMATNDDLCENAIFVGDTEGTLHLIDRKNMSVEYSHRLWEKTNKKNKVTGLAVDRGGLAVSSINGHTDVVHLSDPPERLHNIAKMEGELTAIDFKNHILATAYSTPRVRFWAPLDNNIFG